MRSMTALRRRQGLTGRGDPQHGGAAGEVDMGGYDLVLEANKVLRYVQLKSSHRTSATANVPVNINLEGKPGARVVWMKFDLETVELGPYLWFGAKPGEPALSLGEDCPPFQGDKNGVKAFRPKHSCAADRARPRLGSTDEVVDALFGSPGLIRRT
jgi:hypothetical protein